MTVNDLAALSAPAAHHVGAADARPARVRTIDLHFAYPDGTLAVRGVSLQIHPGEIVAILGSSGAGKSTLMRCLGGQERPTSGTVRHDDVDLASLRGRRLRLLCNRTAMVFQEFQLIGRATVLSNVLIGRLSTQSTLPSLLHVVRRADREIAVGVVRRLGLLDHLRKRADALSGGQRQRVALARALAQQPDLLLADEPVANLDPALAREVVDDILRLVREEHLTAVLNLHDVALARAAADRIVGMRAGAVLWDLPASDVTDDHLAALYGRTDETA